VINMASIVTYASEQALSWIGVGPTSRVSTKMFNLVWDDTD